MPKVAHVPRLPVVVFFAVVFSFFKFQTITLPSDNDQISDRKSI